MKFTSTLTLLAIVLSLSNVLLLRKESKNTLLKDNKPDPSLTGFSRVEQKYKFENFDKIVDIQIDSNTITIKNTKSTELKSPVYLGKGLLNKFEKLLSTNPTAFNELKSKFNAKTLTTDQNIVFDNQENLQFFLFYIVFPPMKDFHMFYNFKYPAPKKDGSKSEDISPNFNFIFKEKANIYQLFSIASASSGMPGFFQKVKCIELSETQMANIDHRFNTVKSLMSTTFKEYTKIEGIKDNILSIAKTSCTSANGKTHASLKSTLRVEKGKELLFTSEATIPKLDLSKVQVTKDQMVYAETDETTHFWMDSNQSDPTIFIVDAGSKFLLADLPSLFNMGDKKKANINIFITHFHSDHVQALARFIKINQAHNITLHVHAASAIQFNGWLMENLSNVYDFKTEKLLFKLEVLDSETKKPKVIGSYTVKPNYDVDGLKISNFAHFIPNVSWLFEKEGECAKIFTGDLNPNGTTPLSKQNFQDYFSNLSSKLSKPKDCKVFFWDFGHFENKYPAKGDQSKDETLASDLKVIGESLGDSYFVFEHYKTIGMFDLIRIPDFTKFKKGGLSKLIQRGTQTFSDKKGLRKF